MEGEITDTNYLGNYLNCQVRIGSYVIGVQLDQFERFSPGKRVYLTFAVNAGVKVHHWPA